MMMIALVIIENTDRTKIIEYSEFTQHTKNTNDDDDDDDHVDDDDVIPRVGLTNLQDLCSGDILYA